MRYRAAKFMCVPVLGAMLTGCGPSVPSELTGKWSCRGVVYEISSRSITKSGGGSGFVGEGRNDSGTVRQVNNSGGLTIVALDGTRMMGTLTLKREGGRLNIEGESCNPG